jgi:hypothetical protein
MRHGSPLFIIYAVSHTKSSTSLLLRASFTITSNSENPANPGALLLTSHGFMRIKLSLHNMVQQSGTEYHHYIPQFLLRQFALDPPAGRRFNKGLCRVNTLDLTTRPPTIKAVLVKKTFGHKDMYKDSSKLTSDEQRHIEKKLASLERDASHIIARVVVAHARGEDYISLSRTDKDILRKFLFVMKYRSPIFFTRFNHETADEYDSSDRDTFLKYMNEKGFKRPIDVWFNNLEKVIDIPMDSDGKWIMQLCRTIYPPDALWLFMIFHSMHLAFVTPSNSDQEFILTENAFSIHEGPTSISIHRVTGKQTMQAYTEFHLLSIVSPNLAMILRHNSLPEPLEDASPVIRQQKVAVLADQARQHLDPTHATSLLLDLPIAKARNPLIVVDNAWLVSGDGAIKNPRPNDYFRFRFFRLESKQTQMINTIMLDQGHHTSSIIFKSETALRTALDFYLDFPTQAKGGHSIKTITDLPDDPMLLLFQKLEHVAHSLGSRVKARYHVDPLMSTDAQLPVPIEKQFEPVSLNNSHGLSRVRLKKAFDILGYDDDTKEQDANLDAKTGESVETDEQSSFNALVHQTLKTATPISSGHPIVLAMLVMIQVLDKQHFNIRATHALDVITACDGTPSFPELVFIATRSARHTDLNQHTKVLRDVQLRLWKLAWHGLVQRALQEPGADLDRDINDMRAKLRQLGMSIGSGIPTKPECRVSTQVEARNVMQGQCVGFQAKSPTDMPKTSDEQRLGLQMVLTYLAIILVGYLGWLYIQ